MATILAVAHHRNEYQIGYQKGNIPRTFASSKSRGFIDVNCRQVEGGMGLLPSPYGSPVSNRGLLSPKPENRYGCVGGKSPFEGSFGLMSKSEDGKQSKKVVKSSPIAITGGKGGGSSKKERVSRENLSFSELWAGPAYSNSPPPTSLPMPKFDMKPKRSVSLDLPRFVSDLNIDMSPMAKSAPPSPTNKAKTKTKTARSCDDIFSDDDSATKTLRRILNLDITDD